MGGTSFDIGIVAEGQEKHYDFEPVIDRWLVSVPMIHLVTLGAGGGSIAHYDRLYDRIKIGPESAGSDPGPACYGRGGRGGDGHGCRSRCSATSIPTTTRTDTSRSARGARNGRSCKRCRNTSATIVLAIARVIRENVDHHMANGIATELRTHGYAPTEFTMLAYGGNGPLHCCGIATRARDPSRARTAVRVRVLRARRRQRRSAPHPREIEIHRAVPYGAETAADGLTRS